MSGALAILACVLAQDGAVPWEADHAASLQRAQEFRKPVLLYFRAET